MTKSKNASTDYVEHCEQATILMMADAKKKRKKQKRTTHKVYLVEDCANAPGRIYAVFADVEGANDFCEHYHDDEAQVVERTLLHGQHIAGADGYIE